MGYFDMLFNTSLYVKAGKMVQPSEFGLDAKPVVK